MKRNSLLLLFTLFSALQTVFAQVKPQTVSSKIEKVTLFTSGGQVMRKAKTTIPQGKTELIFAGISPDIDKQSIQVKGEGNFTILSVIHQTNYLNEQKRREETSLLENQKNALNQKTIVEKKMLQVFKNEENMLLKNQAIGGSQSGVKTADLKEAVDFQRNRLTEVLLKQAEIEKNIEKNDSILTKIDKQLKALNQPKNFATSEVLVTVLSKENTPASFEVSYFVKNAGWFATYDLRVQDISKPIDLDFKANVFQSSGEDWKDVKLIISNGNPTESGIAPNLQAWYLRFGYPQYDYLKTLQGRVAGVNITRQGNEVVGKVISKEDGTPLPGVTVLVKGTTIGTATDVEGNYTLKLPEKAQSLVFSFVGTKTQEKLINSSVIDVALETDDSALQEVVVVGYGVSDDALYKRKSKDLKIRGTASIPMETKETYQATTMSFEIETPYTILNDGKIYTVAIKTQSVPAIYEYFAVPKLEKDAFLTAKIIDWQELNLLEGEVNLFFEGAFLGKSILDIRNANDTLNISLGRDKSIVIERKKLKEYSKKQFLSSYKTESRAYEITVRNNKQQAVQITVLDQFPISTTKEITVEEQEYPEAKLDKDTKQLTWKYELAAKKDTKHSFKYSVKYPKNQVLSLD
jgi:hypothetical protein